MEKVTHSMMMLKLKALREITEHSISVKDICDMMLSDKVFTLQEIHEIDGSYDKVEALFIRLHKKYIDGQIDLINYDWTILPKTSIKITIVSPGKMRELVHEH
jgi:hypothetical protein